MHNPSRFPLRLLAVLLSLFCLVGCSGTPGTLPDPAMTDSGSPEAAAPLQSAEAPAPTTPAEPPTDQAYITWKTAFRWPEAPTGYLPADSVAFYRLDADQEPWVEVLSFAELATYMETADPIPRTHFFDDTMPAHTEDLLPALTYAFNNACPKFCIPSVTLTEREIDGMPDVFLINGASLSTITVSTLTQADGQPVNFLQVSFRTLMRKNAALRFSAGLAEARRLVDGIPAGSTDYQKALYLYSYLAEHVRYCYGTAEQDYYDGEWDLLYDTLIGFETVCSGYTETLYYLFNLAGLDCFTVYGDVRGNLDVAGHIWNVAQLDGQYYMFDVTWDEGLSPAEFCFFAVSQEDMNSYYPRYLYSRCEEYCPPCEHSVFPVQSNEMFSSEHLYAAYSLQQRYGLLLSEPDVFYAVCASGQVTSIPFVSIQDGWCLTNLEYTKAMQTLAPYAGDDLGTDCLARVYREIGGKLAYRPDNGLLRLCDVQEDGGAPLAVLYYIDEFGAVGEPYAIPLSPAS